MTDRRPLVAILVAVAVMAAIFVFTQQRGNSDAASNDTANTTSTTRPVTTGDTTSAGLTEPTAAGADWQAGLERVTRIENDLFQNPDPGRIDEIMLPSCSCYQETLDRLTSLQVNDQKVAGANIVLENIRFQGQTGSDAQPRVDVIADINSGGFATVDASGNTVEAAPESNLYPFRYFLDKGTDGQWRIADRGVAGDIR